MRTHQNESEAELAPAQPANVKPPDIASASVPGTLAALHVNPDARLTHPEVDVRRKEHGYSEVAEQGVAVDHSLCPATLLRPGGGQSELKRESLGSRKRVCLF